jgi:triphosphoribosyl-dephospho-CoA synthase
VPSTHSYRSEYPTSHQRVHVISQRFKQNQEGPSSALTAPRPRWNPRAVAEAGQLACLLEVSAEKPGNITPSHDFATTSYEDMVRSAVAIGWELARSAERRVGEGVLGVVRASRRAAPSNTNLGIALLLVPLARAALVAGPPPELSLRDRVSGVLRALDVEDARHAYAAIRLAQPGGLNERVEHDVRDEPTVTLRCAMVAAAERDRVAAEYATDFATTFETGLPALARALAAGLRLRDALVELFLELLAAMPDTLIARKRGADVAAGVSERAAEALAAGGVRTPQGRRTLAGFDASLRAPDNALNPGTTADLVASVVFVALLEGRV